MLRERAWLILGVTAAFALAALYLDRDTQTLYASSATLRLESAVAEAPLLYLKRAESPEAPIDEANDFGTVILPAALQDAAKRLRKTHPGVQLAGQPLAGPAGVGLMRVGVRHPDPRQGAIIAQALAEAVVKQVRKQERRAIDRMLRASRRQQRDFERAIPKDPYSELDRLLTERDRINLGVLREATVGATIVSPARPSSAPVVRKGRTLGPMIALGLSLALIAAFLLDAFDRRPRDPRRLAASGGLPLAAVVPRFGRRVGTATDAFHRVRALVEPRAHAGSRLVAVTSAETADGKSTVAVGLGEAAAEAGVRACVIEANLTRPVLAARLGLSGPGVAEVVRGEAGLETALHELRAPGADGGTPVTLMAAGRTARDAEPVTAEAWRKLLLALGERFELVVVECPPTSEAADALAICAIADAVLVSARPGITPGDELREAVYALRLIQADPVGVVVSGAPETEVNGQGARESRAARKLRMRWVASVPSLRGGR